MPMTHFFSLPDYTFEESHFQSAGAGGGGHAWYILRAMVFAVPQTT